MNFLIRILKEFPYYLWSGWGAMASVFLFFALWEVGSQAYGSLALPSPKETLLVLWGMLDDTRIMGHAAITVERSLYGFGFSVLIGTLLGLMAGFFATASMMSRPIATIFMGMPPIAWIVLAMLWFGMGDTTVTFTVVVASFPVVFMGAMQGSRTIEGNLKEMADSFRLPWWMKWSEVYFPHLFSYLFPAWVSALGLSWKIVMMAELLSASDGLGAQLAVARSHLDTPAALALVVIMIATLMIMEYLILEPIKREVEQWRD